MAVDPLVKGCGGIGEVDSAPLAVKGSFSYTTASGSGHLIIGEGPFRTKYLWHKMYRATSTGVGLHAIGGINPVLWDVKGKAPGMPAWKLPGGRIRREFAALRQFLVWRDAERNGRAGTAVHRSGVRDCQVRLGSDGSG